MSLPGRGSWLRFFRGGPITAVTAPGTLGAPTFRIAMLRLPAWALRTDRGKNHDPAAMTPDLTSASRRARSRQDHAATRGPAARLDPISARRAQGVWAGTKSGLQAEQKATFVLQRAQRIKSRETALFNRTRKHGWRFGLIVKAQLETAFWQTTSTSPVTFCCEAIRGVNSGWPWTPPICLPRSARSTHLPPPP